MGDVTAADREALREKWGSIPQGGVRMIMTTTEWICMMITTTKPCGAAWRTLPVKTLEV
jgi:hypothetical protein